MWTRLADVVAGWQTILIQIGISILILCLVFGVGYIVGYKHMKKKYDVFVAQAEILGKVAKEQTKNQIKAQDAVTRQTKEEYENEVDAIHAYYSAHPVVVLRDRSGVRGQTTPAHGSSCLDDSPAKSVAPGPNPERGTTEVDEKFVLACIHDAAQVRAFQMFIQHNGFPIR